MLGEFQCPLSDKMYEESSGFQKTWRAITIRKGAKILVESRVGSEDGAEFSRARWAALVFRPADQKTRQATRKLLAARPAETAQDGGGTPMPQEPLQQPS